MADAWIAALKVVDLKEELKKRGLPVSGKKADLAERLEAYVRENEGNTEEQAHAAERTASPPSAGADGEEEAKEEAAAEEEDKAPAGTAAEVEPAAKEEEAAQEEAEEASSAAAAEEEPQAAAATEQNAEPAAGAVAPAAEAAPAPVSMEEEPAAVEEKEPAAAPAAAEPGPAEPAAAPEEAAAADAAPEAPEVDLDYGEESDEEHPRQHAQQQQQQGATADEAAERGAAPKRKRPSGEGLAAVTAAAGSAERPAKVARTASNMGKVEKGEGVPPEEVPAAEQPATRALLILGLVRPFTERQVRELLGETGKVVALWMPSIKTHAYVIFETKAQAEATRVATYRLQWPATNPKRLEPSFVPLSEAEAVIGNGAGNPDYRVARTEEDGPDDALPPSPKDAGKEGEGQPSGGAPDRQPSGVGDRSKREWNRDKAPPVEPPAGPAVRDLRDLLSSRRSGAGAAGTSPGAPDRPGGAAAPRGERVRAPRGPPGPVKTLDDLFRKTAAKPSIYWLPLTEAQIVERKAKAAEAAVAADTQGVQDGDTNNKEA